MSDKLSDKLPWFEDVMEMYLRDLMRKLYPPQCRNRWFVYLVGFFHMIGAWVLSYGVLLPPGLLPIYLIYGFVNLVSYQIFNQKCFMTLLANHYGGVHTTPLQIRTRTALIGLIVNSVLAILGIIVPSLSLYAIVRFIFI